MLEFSGRKLYQMMTPAEMIVERNLVELRADVKKLMGLLGFDCNDSPMPIVKYQHIFTFYPNTAGDYSSRLHEVRIGAETGKTSLKALRALMAHELCHSLQPGVSVDYYNSNDEFDAQCYANNKFEQEAREVQYLIEWARDKRLPSWIKNMRRDNITGKDMRIAARCMALMTW